MIFRRPPPRLLALHTILTECKQLPLICINTLHKKCIKLGFSYKRRNRKMEMQLIVGVVFPACNYIKKETQVQAFPCEFCQFFKPKTLFETKLGHGCSLVNVDTFFSLQLYQKQDFGIGVF